MESVKIPEFIHKSSTKLKLKYVNWFNVGQDLCQWAIICYEYDCKISIESEFYTSHFTENEVKPLEFVIPTYLSL